jgi:ankyrin repeat protein
LCLLLLNHLADPNAVDNGGRSPLEFSVNKKPFPYSIVDRLYRNGGDIEDSKVPAAVKATLEEIKNLADKEDVGYNSEEESEEEIEDPDL